MVINITNLKNIATEFGCEFVENASMKDYTTFKTGGSCPLLISPNSVTALSETLKECKKSNIPYTVLGNGSNVLVEDDGIDGVVIHIADDLNKITLLDETTIFCEAGVKLGTLCNFALENSLTGLEFAFGIPGSVGGAIFMNANSSPVSEFSNAKLQSVPSFTPASQKIVVSSSNVILFKSSAI